MEILIYAFQCEKRVTANWGRKMSYHILLIQNVGKHWKVNTYSFFYRIIDTIIQILFPQRNDVFYWIYIYIYIYEMLVRIKV